MRLAQRLGRYAAVTQLVFAGVLGGVASLHAEPGVVPRGPVLLVIFALPAVVGWLGLDRGRPALVAAAALTSGIGALIAFSGVTLIFLLPASMFFASALALTVPGDGERRGSIITGVGQLALAAVISTLIVGAGASALLITDSSCWIVHQTAFGSTIEAMPWSTGEMTLPLDAMSGGCSTGQLSPRGIGLGALLAVVALGLAAFAARRPVQPAIDPPAPGPIG